MRKGASLADALAEGVAPGCGVVLTPLIPWRASLGRGVHYFIEAGMHFEGNRLHGAFALYEARGNRLVAALQGEPMRALTAAKILLLCGQVHFGLVERVVDDVLEHSTAQTAALAVRAQLHMYRGDISQALALYEHCLQVAEPGGEFQVYLLVLKGKALLSDGNHDAACHVVAELHAVKPETRYMTGIQAVPADAVLPADLAAHLRAMSPDGARALVAHCWYFSERLFRETTRQFNVMRNVVAHAVAAFGDVVVPEAVREAVPGLVHGHPDSGIEVCTGTTCASSCPAFSRHLVLM